MLSKLSKLPKSTAKDALAFAKKYKPSHAFLRSSKAGGGRSDLPGSEETVDGVLTDQNGRFVRYEVMVNKDEYDFIMQPDSDPENHLWSLQGQNAYFQKNPSIKMLSMPSGRVGGPVGAMEIKAAWKVLNEAEIAGNRYFMLKDAMLHTGGAGFQKATMGLVGMHIVHKTVTAPQGVWSTFEHVDNILSPTGGGGAFNNVKCAQTPVYSNPSPAVPCTGECCAPNTQTASRDKNGAYNELDAQGKAIHRPVQVLRAQKSGDRELNQINEEFQRLLAGTVWANYKLIGTQWPSEPLKNGKAKPPSMDVKPEPKVLANVVMETFNQGPEEPQDTTPPYPYSLEKGAPSPFSAAVSSSCIGCHSVAKTAGGPNGAKFSNYADFSMILGNAQELPEAKGAKKTGPAR